MSRIARLWPFIALGGLILVAMLAAGLQGRPAPTGAGPTPNPAPTLTMAPPASSGFPLEDQGHPNPFFQVLANVILLILLAVLALAALALLAVAIRSLVRAWRARPLRRAGGADVDVGMSVEPVVEPDDTIDDRSVRRGITAALHDVDEQSRPADAIVAAWLGLEQSAADAGAARGASETPGEFTLRIITRKEGLSVDTETLLGLYQSVRFGDRVADETDRATARAALQRIEEAWR